MRHLRPALLALPLLLAGCVKEQPPQSNEPVKQYQIHGEIVRLQSQDNLATIKHQKIVGYMGAMTMTFPVKSTDEFKSLKPGDCIDGTLYVQGDSVNYWVAGVKHLDTPEDQCVKPEADGGKSDAKKTD